MASRGPRRACHECRWPTKTLRPGNPAQRPNGGVGRDSEIVIKIPKFAAGAVFVAAVTAGMVGATPASAGPAPAPKPPSGPGISYQNGSGKPVTFGSGATAKAEGTNSQALAINTGLNLFGPNYSHAQADGDGATAVSIDGFTSVTGSNTHGFAALGQTNVHGADNDAVTLVGATARSPRALTRTSTATSSATSAALSSGTTSPAADDRRWRGERVLVRYIAQRPGRPDRDRR